MPLEIKREHTVDEIFDLIRKGQQTMPEYKASLSTAKMRNFFHHGVKCKNCDVKGNVFRLQRYSDARNWHLNLYQVSSGNPDILITMDHVIPKSKGGIKDINNIQPLCSPCNNLKGNKLPGNFQPRKASKRVRQRRKSRVRVISWNRLFSLRVIWIITKLILTFNLPGIPKDNINKRNLRWYHVEVQERRRRIK